MDLSKLALAGLLAISAPALAGDAPDKEAAADEKKAGPGDSAHSEVHDCAGKNVCKGMGGCKVSSEQLEKMAKAMGVDKAAAGEAHDCKGLNSCKGLGGCKVDEAGAAKLKEKLKDTKKDEQG